MTNCDYGENRENLISPAPKLQTCSYADSFGGELIVLRAVYYIVLLPSSTIFVYFVSLVF